MSSKGLIHRDQSFIVKNKTEKKKKNKMIPYGPGISYDELFRWKPASHWLEVSYL